MARVQFIIGTNFINFVKTKKRTYCATFVLRQFFSGNYDNFLLYVFGVAELKPHTTFS